jgi:hypothetical protein
MILKVNGIIDEIVQSQFKDEYCFILFKKKHEGEPYLMAISCNWAVVKSRKLKKGMMVFCSCLFKSTGQFGKYYSYMQLIRVSIRDFDINTNYYKPQKKSKKTETIQGDELFSELQ